MNYKQLAIAGIALLTLATSGCGGGAPATQPYGAVVITHKAGKDGNYIDRIDCSGLSEGTVITLAGQRSDYTQRRLDAVHANAERRDEHTEKMYNTASRAVSDANRNQPADKKQDKSPAQMQEDLYERSLKL